MYLPEECNFQYPKLFWKQKVNRYVATIATKLFKEQPFNLGEKIDHFNNFTFSYFETKDGLIHDNQHKNLTYFLNNQDVFKREIEKVILNYLNTEVKEILDASDYSDLIEKKVSEMVLLHHVHLPYSTDERIIGFEFECLWDSEHGFGTKFHNDLLTHVGMADVSF